MANPEKPEVLKNGATKPDKNKNSKNDVKENTVKEAVEKTKDSKSEKKDDKAEIELKSQSSTSDSKKSSSHRKSDSDDKRRSRRSRSRSKHDSSTRKHESSRSGYHRSPRTSSSRYPQDRVDRVRRRRSTSRDLVEEFLERTNRRRSRSKSPYSKRSRRSPSPKVLKRKDNEIFNEKLNLTAQGRWTDELENNWKLMEKEEDLLVRKFHDYRKELDDRPEAHPRYATEWKEFWESRYQAVEDMGMDPETYDYTPEWKEFWNKRVLVLLDTDHNVALEETRKKYGMDIFSLRRLNIAFQTAPMPLMQVPMAHPMMFHNPPQAHAVLPMPMNFNPVQQPIIQQQQQIMQKQNLQNMVKMSNPIVRKQVEQPKTNVLQAPVTVNDIKSTWESLTRQLCPGVAPQSAVEPKQPEPKNKEVVQEPVNEPSDEIENEQEFDGFSLIQVLHLISGLDDQLSFLLPKLQEFLKKAEELEVTKPKRSYSLLRKVDFVRLLVKCRDRFNTLIQANILPPKTLQTLKLSTYLLNLILKTPQCQKLSSQPGFLQGQTKQDLVREASLAEESRKKQESGKISRSAQSIRREQTPKFSGEVSLAKKRLIADLLTTNLMSLGKRDSDFDLNQFVFSLLQPLIKHDDAVKRQGRPPVTSLPSNQKKTKSTKTPFADMRSHRTSSPHRRSPDTRELPERVVGTALPPLPTISVRAASPPRGSRGHAVSSMPEMFVRRPRM